MKIKLLKYHGLALGVGDAREFQPGMEIDVPKSVADHLVEIGVAKVTTAPEPVKKPS